MKGIQQTAPEQNTRHGVSCIAIKKNDLIDSNKQSAQCNFITENIWIKYTEIEESLKMSVEMIY